MGQRRADQAKALALIKSSASLSLGVIEHSNFGGYLSKKISAQLLKGPVRSTWHSHSHISLDRLGGRHQDWNLVPVLVFGPGDVKHGQHGRRHDEERRVDKVPSGAYPPARAECERDCRIVAELGPVGAEETFGLECLWVWVELRVV
jgi:hypothetical protein